MKNIFVGNLPYQTTESDLRALFEAHGGVERVSIPTDRQTGRVRGFAFVEMGDDAAAGRAIAALNGSQINGRALNVNEARPREAAGGGGSGYRFVPPPPPDDYGRREGGRGRGGRREGREPRW